MFLFFFKFNKVNFVVEKNMFFDLKTLSLMEVVFHTFCVDTAHSSKKFLIIMNKIVGFLFFLFFFISCQQKVKSEDIVKINGYWEIEKVVFDQGKNKEYGVNESYDYFKINRNNKGFRKKVMPQLDGTFIVNDTYENVQVRFENDKVWFDYSTPYSKWTEELIVISEKELIFENSEKKEYYYKKAEPINILSHGKKTK